MTLEKRQEDLVPIYLKTKRERNLSSCFLLVKHLKSNIGIDIAYDHDSDVVILLRGKFIPEPSGEHAVLADGEIQEFLEELRASNKMTGHLGDFRL
jgi:hypothetical protein